MRNLLQALVLGTVLSAAVCGPALAAPNSPKRLEAYAKLPDWSGIWESDREVSQGTANAPVGYADSALITLAALPPFNEKWKAQLAERMKTDKSMRPADKVCSFGFPGMMGGPHMFQMFVTPEETLIVARGDELRHVYTDGREHPGADDIWPTPMGDSIGHWEGETLVIDTIARNEGPIWTDGRYPISENAHFVERIKMIDKDHLVNDLTISDPTSLSKDIHVVLRYRRVTDIDRMFYESCTENDRNVEVDGQLTIAPSAKK